MKTCELFNIIPKNVTKHILYSGDSELEADFMGFENVYRIIRDNVPKDFVICDMGCYMAAQSYLFKDFAGYIGVDSYDSDHRKANADLYGYHPPKRFRGHKNTKHFNTSIQEFLKTPFFKNLDLDKTYFIASYVPDFEATTAMFSAVKNASVIYIGQPNLIKGINKNEIDKCMKNRKDY